MKKALNSIKESVARFLNRHTKRIINVDEGKLKYCPNIVIWLVYIMCLSVLFQGIADVLIKVLGGLNIIPSFPWRMDFIFLTGISVLMGYQSLMGLRRRELDVTRNSVQIGLLVETALVIGDIYFLAQYPEQISYFLPVRLPFIILTSINILILIYVSKRIHLFRDELGNWRWF